MSTDTSNTLDGDSPTTAPDAIADKTYLERLYLSLAELFYPVYKWLFSGERRFIEDLEQDLSEANINVPAEIYLSFAVAIGMIVGSVIGLGTGSIVYIALNSDFTLTLPSTIGVPSSEALDVGLPIPADASWVDAVYYIAGVLKVILAVGFSGLLGAGFGLVMSIGIARFYPSMSSYSRRRQINLVLPDAVAFMYSLSVGGMDQMEIFAAIADSEDTYGEVSTEFKRIVHEMHYFNTDYQTAVRRVADTTPSEELSKFLTDMLSIINSGGDMDDFLESQKDYQMQQVKRKQSDHLETLEMFGEMYMALSILPMVLLIILVIMALLGNPRTSLLLLIVYFLLPFLNLMFGFIIAIVKQDEVGDGTLKAENAMGSSDAKGSLFDLGIIEAYQNDDDRNDDLFEQIQSLELRHRVGSALRSPLKFFRERPPYILTVTLPASITAVLFLVGAGAAVPNPVYIRDNIVPQTIFWFFVPLYINLIPLSLFYEWKARTIATVTDTLTGDLRKLANTNETGQPLLEALKITSEDNPSRLGNEFANMYKKVQFGQPLSTALVEFNNRYKIPRLARTVKLIEKAQEASSQITDVLKTAAQASENQDDLLRERKSRTRMQVVVIAVTYFVFLAVMIILQEFFINQMVSIIGSDPAWPNFDNVNPGFLSMMYFHASMLQGICAGFISGYIQTGDVWSSYKYILGYTLIGLMVFAYFTA